MQLSKSEIFNIVSILKGFAIVMVVFLHMEMGKGNDLFVQINTTLRPFRMPVFMFASGFLYFYVSKNKYPGYVSFIVEKFKRLIIPLLFIKIFFSVLKFILSFFLQFLNTNYFVEPFNYKLFLQNLLLYPTNDQVAIQLWFVYVLFVIFAVVHLFSSKLYLLTLFSLVLYFIPLPHIFGLYSVGLLLIFFCLGGIFHKFLPFIKISMNQLIILLISAFCVSLVLLSITNSVSTFVELNTFMKNLVGIVFVVTLSTILALIKENLFTKNIKFIGQFSASIFFLFSFCYRGYAFLSYRFTVNCSEGQFWCILLLGLVTSVYGSIFLDKYLISKSNVAGLLLLGRKLNILT